MDRKVITMCHFNRPKYTRATLEHLAHCEGIEDYKILPTVDPYDEQVIELVASIDFAETEAVFNERRYGCGGNTQRAVRRGFEQSDFVIHVEDDILFSRDALKYFEFCRDRYRGEPAIFSISAYRRTPKGMSRKHFLEMTRRQWFCPCGWATWRDRWEEMDRHWDRHNWGPHLRKQVRGDRWEMYPSLSRSQNIGAEWGAHRRDPRLHRLQDHVEFWAGEVEDFPSGEFHEGPK